MNVDFCLGILFEESHWMWAQQHNNTASVCTAVLQGPFYESRMVDCFCQSLFCPHLFFMWSFKYLLIEAVFPHLLQGWLDQICRAPFQTTGSWMVSISQLLSTPSFHVIIQIPRRWQSLSTSFARIVRPSLPAALLQQAPFWTTGWLTGFANALQLGDKGTARREVGVRQRSSSCKEHLAGEMVRLILQVHCAGI